MDWGFLDIFKRADFNSLMLSIAIAGWILYFFVPMNIYIVGAALLSTAYCIIRLIVYIYQCVSVKIENKRHEAQKKKEKEKHEAERKEARNIEISRMFNGLTENNKKILAYILLKGKKDDYNYNILYFTPYSDDSFHVQQAVDISKIFRDFWGNGDDCIWIKHYTDTLAATIDPYLYDLVKAYIDENNWKLIKI